MIFLTPLGPGLESSNAFVESNGVATIEVQGYATHFENSPSEIRGFLQCDEGQIIIECSNIDVKSNTILSLNALMPDTAPSSSWNLHLSVKNDGALYLRLAHLRYKQGLLKESESFASKGLMLTNISSWERLLLNVYLKN